MTKNVIKLWIEILPEKNQCDIFSILPTPKQKFYMHLKPMCL